MYTWFHRQLTPPTFADDEDKTRIARWLNVILLIAAAIAIIYSFLSPLIDPKPIQAITINGIMLAIYGSMLVLIRKGYVSVASVIFSAFLWIAVTLSVIAYGSILSPGFLCYFGVIAVVGLFLGGRAALGFAVLTLLTTLGFVYAEQANLLPPPILPITFPIVGYAAAANFVLVSLMSYLALRALREALARARQELRERQQAEERLRISEERFRAIVENISDAIALVSVDGTIYYLSPTAEHMLGYSIAERTGKSAFDNITRPEDAAYMRRLFVELQAAPRGSKSYEMQFRHKNGSSRWIEATATNQLGLPSVQAIVINYRDVTERKQVELALRASEKKFRTFFDISPFPIMILQINGRFTDVNSTFLQEIGLTHEQVVGRTVEEIGLSIGGRQYAEDIRDKLLASKRVDHEEVTVTYPNGRKGVFLFSSQFLEFQDERQILTIAVNITERKQMEEEAHRSEERYWHTIEAAGGIPYFLEYATSALRFEGDGILNLTGYSSEEMTHELWDSLVEETFLLGDAAQYSFEEAVRRSRAGELPAWRCEYRIHTRDGQSRWVVQSAIELIEASGVSKGSIGMLQDVTERKQAEQRLQDFRDKLKLLHDVSLTLTNAKSFGDLCRMAVELGRTKLGFDRIGIWLADDDPNFMLGTFGTSETGEVRDERGNRFPLVPDPHFNRRIPGAYMWEDIALVNDHNEVVGRGWAAEANLWDGERVIGWISIDNLVKKELFSQQQLDLLLLYGITLGHLYTRKRAEEALRESEERYRVISSISSDYVFSDKLGKDGKFHLEWVSGAFEAITGYSMEEYEANGGWIATLHPDDREQDARDMAALYANQKVISEIRTYRKNGELRWIRNYAHPVWDAEHNQLRGIYGAVQDITERKKAEAEIYALNAELEQRVAQRTQQLANAHRESECLFRIGEAMNASTSYREILEAIPKAMGEIPFRISLNIYENHNRQGATFIESVAIYDPRQRKSDAAEWRMPVSSTTGDMSNPYVIEDTGARDDIDQPQAALYLQYGIRSVMAVGIFLGQRESGALAFTLSEPYQFSPFEHRVLRGAADLTAAAVERVRLLSETETARQAAEDANRIKSQFLANMSHELRTPLNAILNFNAFVADGLMGPVNEEQVEILSQSISSGKHLLSLINDILDVTKIEAGLMDLFIEKIDLNEILDSTLSVSRGLVKDKPIELITEIEDGLPATFGDKRRLRQVFLNLVSNAVKFTPKGNVTIKAYRDEGNVQISIRDTGIGIAPEDKGLVFESFKQATNNQLDTVGTGLGLPISKFLVETHGGRIWLDSEIGIGTTFHVVLPILSEAQARARSAKVNV